MWKTGTDPPPHLCENRQTPEITRTDSRRHGTILLPAPDEPTIPTRARRPYLTNDTPQPHQRTPRPTTHRRGSGTSTTRLERMYHRLVNSVPLGIGIMDRVCPARVGFLADGDGARVARCRRVLEVGRGAVGKGAAEVLGGLGAC